MTRGRGPEGSVAAEVIVRVKHENLRVWSEAMVLSERVYKETSHFPREESLGLSAHIRRSAVSVAVNIAEGCGRYHTREFVRFLFIARGSLFELMTLLDLSRRLGYLSVPQYISLRDSCEGLLTPLSGLIRSLKGTRRRGAVFNAPTLQRSSAAR
ncbi:MAG: four helix bundle protein [Armatimonadota bacterium]|nr:four helix bundle protein [Armatimonadota bacterium]MDR7588504.1 four helix bundle protein [Armatimonadota bacterium]MDR7612030.1 four helix bundle protein [Armatimonadota bacterium]